VKKKKYGDNAQIKKRIGAALIAITVVFTMLSIRLSYIMIAKQAEYSALANEQWTSEVKIDAKRGKILDRNGTELALSANVYRVDFDLNSIRDYLGKDKKGKAAGYTKTSDIAPLIAEALGMDEAAVQKSLDTTLPSGAQAGSATLIRRIEKQQADKVKALEISGVIVSPDTKRYYPNDNFLAHVLGSTNTDGQGLTGVELKYNNELSGVAGMKITELDNRDDDLPYTISQFTEPVDGKDVTLTIDSNIQFFAEKIAAQALTDQKAKAISVLVMDPKTGEILAMVNKPDFNPNSPYEGTENFEGATEGDRLQKMWRNRLVNDTFEPGSIFKVITAITAMEEGLVSENDTFVCNGGLNFGNRRIKCWDTRGHGTQHLGDIIQNSCNVGFMQLGEKIGKEKLYESIKKFGFGSTVGVDLPGEASGIVKTPENTSVTDLATISFGQTNTVNSVQYMAAFNTIANGGTWIQPHIMKEVSHDDNGTRVVDDTFEPTKKTLASAENTAELRGYLERVVTAGSAKNTFIEGYHIGGKTGTAQKVINGVYAEGKYISSFVGMAPVDDPKVTIMITCDEPGTGAYYAGLVSVPYAKTLFTDMFNYLDSKYSQENENYISKDVVIPEVRGLKLSDAQKKLKEMKLDYEVIGDGSTVKTITPFPGYAVKEGAKVKLDTAADSTNSVIMPSLAGYSLEDAKALLDSLGIGCTISGDGVVNKQGVPEGEMIEKGTTVRLELSSEYKNYKD
jgi:stage V sporulation protein D (sporulation-specific penicillin-binding protein)